jgi:hypothetical protein
MQNLSLHRNHFARIVAWLTILAIAVLSGWAAPAEARRINATIVDIGPIPYSPGVTSDVARLLITGTYNGASLEMANSAPTINPGGEEIIVRPSASASSQPEEEWSSQSPASSPLARRVRRRSGLETC